MPETHQETKVPETRISVDLTEADIDKAVERKTVAPTVAQEMRETQDPPAGRTKAEKELYKRMARFERNINQQFNQKMADREAVHQRELSALKEQFESVSIERQDDKELTNAHERVMADLTTKLAAANEKGDSGEAARLTAEMIKLDGQYHAKLAGSQARRDTQGTASKTSPRQETASPQTTTAAAKTTGPTPAGSRFILANEDWWEDPAFKIEVAAASSIYVDLTNNEGFDANDDETFKEVARQLKAKFPALDVRNGKNRHRERPPEEDLEDDDGATLATRRAPAPRLADRGSAENVNRGSRRELTAEDMKTMRDCGLSPDNDRDVVQYLKEAVALERAS